MVEHSRALTTGARMLNMDTTKGVSINLRAEMNLVRKGGMSWLRCSRRDVSREQTPVEMERNSTIGTITG